MNKKASIWIKRIGTLITILSLVFILKVAVSLECDFSVLKTNSALVGCFLGGSIIMCMTVYIIAYGWKMILVVLSKQTVRYKDAFAIYAKANMGKYLPGNVMHYVERNLFARNLGLDQRAVLLSTMTEISGLVFVSVLVGIAFEGKHLWNLLKVLIDYKYILVVLLLSCLLVLLILAFRKKIEEILKNINVKEFCKVFIKVCPAYFCFVLLGGIVMGILFEAILPDVVTTKVLLRIVASYTIAWVVGFMIPGSPGGIGVREFVLLFLLGEYFPEDILLANIVLHRFISIVGDALAYASSLLLKYVSNR